MIIKFIILNVLIILSKSIKVQGDECSCQDFQIVVCEDHYQCSINGSACGNLICGNRNLTSCTDKLTNYKCKWDPQQQKCLDHTYTCTDLNHLDCTYNSQRQFNCVSDSNQNCVNFFCAGASPNCPLNLCSYFYKDGCKDPIQGLDCSTLNSTQCNEYYDGNGHVCNWNDEGKCKSYNLYGLWYRCSEWNDSESGCEKINCVYDKDNKQCRESRCIELQKDRCTVYNKNNEDKILELCKWVEDRCSQLEIADIAQFSEYECQEKTGKRFYWNKTYGCQPCKSIKIIDSGSELCDSCLQKVSTCSTLKNTYPSLYDTCCIKIYCPECPKINTCYDIKKYYLAQFNQCASTCPNITTSNNICSNSISNCTNLVNNYNQQCNKTLQVDTYCPQQITCSSSFTCDDLKLNYPTCCNCQTVITEQDCPQQTFEELYIIFLSLSIVFFLYSIIVSGLCWYYYKQGQKKKYIEEIKNPEIEISRGSQDFPNMNQR